MMVFMFESGIISGPRHYLFSVHAPNSLHVIQIQENHLSEVLQVFIFHDFFYKL